MTLPQTLMRSLQHSPGPRLDFGPFLVGRVKDVVQKRKGKRGKGEI